MSDDAIDWKLLHEDALTTLGVAILFYTVVMWIFPAFGLLVAGVVYLITRAAPAAVIFTAAALIVHVVYRVKLHRLTHQPLMLLTARVTGKDRRQSPNSTTQMWRHFVSLDVQQQRRITERGPEVDSELPAPREYHCQGLVYDEVEVGDVRHFVRLGDGEIAGFLGDDGRMVRRG